jgi:hypothetical protein
MSTNKAIAVAKETAVAVFEGVCSPITASLRVIGIALGQPDLDAAATQALQEDVVRLYAMILQHVSRLDEDMKAKVDAVELGEVITQSFVNMGRTASSQKRLLMTNVVVNGIDPKAADRTELRIFVHAIADLDLAHVDLLRIAAARGDDVVEPPDGDLGSALVQPLVARGFVIVAPVTIGDESHSLFSQRYEITDLGRRFVSFLENPEE